MKQMKFSNPVFHPGINVTVREGHKWSRKLLPGDEFMAEGRRAMTHFVHTCRFNMIPSAMLAQEHDPICRNAEGLFRVMTMLYPGFTRSSEVTIIGFEVLNDEGKAV